MNNMSNAWATWYAVLEHRGHTPVEWRHTLCERLIGRRHTPVERRHTSLSGAILRYAHLYDFKLKRIKVMGARILVICQ